jgi:hypothetical protein
MLFPLNKDFDFIPVKSDALGYLDTSPGRSLYKIPPKTQEKCAREPNLHLYRQFSEKVTKRHLNPKKPRTLSEQYAPRVSPNNDYKFRPIVESLKSDIDLTSQNDKKVGISIPIGSPINVFTISNSTSIDHSHGIFHLK